MLASGGAGLAAMLIRHGLVDEYRLFIGPVVLGGGTPFFPSGIEYLRYRVGEES